MTFEQVAGRCNIAPQLIEKQSDMNINTLSTRQKASILRITGLAVAVATMVWLKTQEATLPQEGFGGKTFCNVMLAISLTVFAAGSFLRIKAVREEN